MNKRTPMHMLRYIAKLMIETERAEKEKEKEGHKKLCNICMHAGYLRTDNGHTS